jgi:sugar lactone lactonase YvrE
MGDSCTAKRNIYALDLESQDNSSGQTRFVQLKAEEEGYPDGITVDSKNCIWLCHFGGAPITRSTPSGEVLQVITTPVPNITSCTFAGPALDTLNIATARYLLREKDAEKIS